MSWLGKGVGFPILARVLFGVLLVLAWTGCIVGAEDIGKVTKVIDGDTLRVALAGGEVSVRLIGIDAPEVSHPEVPVQRFGQEATEFALRFAEGFECRLEYEEGQERLDKYGRTLAYVWINGECLNEAIVRRGYTYAVTRFPFSRMQQYVDLERQARKNQYGLWNDSLRDGRLANLAQRFEALPPEGKKDLDGYLDYLATKYNGEALRPASGEKVPETPVVKKLVLLEATKGATMPEQASVISWKDAAKHYGENTTVEGTIVKSFNSGKACFLNFHPQWKKYFTAVIFKSAFSKFPENPEQHYLGKKVRVVGTIKEYEGKPEIILDAPEQIEIVQ